MQRAFGSIRPSVCLLMELEVWPNFVTIAKRSGIPVVVVNGRISDKSFASYRKIRPIVKKMFTKVTLTLAQTDEYARRFRELGCPADKVIVTGSLKYDTAQTTDRVAGAEVLAKQLAIADEPLWVAGGTGNDEEKILLEVYQQLKRDDRFADLRLAIVPRKPERFDEVAELIRQMGFDLIRYSQAKSGTFPSPADKQDVILGDTMGDLRRFYWLARIVFVGRSLVPMGGSDMMEAAALGKCTIFGPHAFNFKQTVDALLAKNGAIMVTNKDELLEAMNKCLTEPEYTERIARAGRDVIIKNQGATQKTTEQITKILDVA
jgi:3-deoxy-D-manno-octulosonic-acid transferase